MLKSKRLTTDYDFPTWLTISCVTILLIVLFGSVTEGTWQARQESELNARKPNKSGPVEIIGEVLVRPKKPGAKVFPEAFVNLGEVECGKQYLLKIRLINETAETLRFRRVGASCSCIDLRVPKGDVPVGEQLDVEALITIPEQQESRLFGVGVDFFADEEGRDEVPFLHVTGLSKNVRGLVCFAAVPSVVEIGKSLNTISLPLIVTEPIEPNSLIVEKSESLQDAVLSVVASEKQAKLVVDIHGLAMEEGFVDCWVKVIDPQSNRSAEAKFILQRRPLFSVSPKILVFSEEPESNGWKANAFLLIDKSIVEEADISNGADGSPQIEVEIDGHALEIKSTRIRAGIYRLELRTSGALPSDVKEGDVNWSVEFHSLQARLKSLWRVWE